MIGLYLFICMTIFYTKAKFHITTFLHLWWRVDECNEKPYFLLLSPCSMNTHVSGHQVIVSHKVFTFVSSTVVQLCSPEKKEEGGWSLWLTLTAKSATCDHDGSFYHISHFTTLLPLHSKNRLNMRRLYIQGHDISLWCRLYGYLEIYKNASYCY